MRCYVEGPGNLAEKQHCKEGRVQYFSLPSSVLKEERHDADMYKYAREGIAASRHLQEGAWNPYHFNWLSSS